MSLVHDFESLFKIYTLLLHPLPIVFYFMKKRGPSREATT